MASIPGTTVQFVHVCFNVDERRGPYSRKVSEVTIRAVESLYGVALANAACGARLLGLTPVSITLP